MADSEQKFFESESQLKTEVAREELVAEETTEEVAAGAVEEEQALGEQAELEEIQANNLALQRDQEQEAQEIDALSEEGRSFGNPSLIKYLILFFMLAIPNDAIDSLELTGYLVILTWFVSLLLSMSSIIISWFFNTEQARANHYMQKVEEYQRTIAHTTRTALRVGKFFKKFKFARKVTKNPTFKIIAGTALEMIPLISIFPWSSISVILAYLDERKTYKNTRETSEEIANTSIESPEMV